jgi:hypothetical protein
MTAQMPKGFVNIELMNIDIEDLELASLRTTAVDHPSAALSGNDSEAEIRAPHVIRVLELVSGLMSNSIRQDTL